ncbi:MAG: hypothetical protein GY943_02010 [Chloroflexi bacterium]|nr:hypothetical protein [Chloroflexota bacterium]
MNVGMLWLDDDKKRPFDEKVKRAADYYVTKYGRMPTVCLVNPKMLAQEKKIDEINVSPIRTVLPYYFWLGVEPN